MPVDAVMADVPQLAPGGAQHEVVNRATALRSTLEQNAETTDRERVLSADTIAGLRDAGLTRLLAPARHGGLDIDMRDLLDIGIELGRGCCSASWVMGVLSSGNLVVSLYPERAQKEVWQHNPDSGAALVLGKPATEVVERTDGVLVSGEWGYCSGIQHTDWINVLVLAGPQRTPHLALLPLSDLTVKDTWRAIGLCGTGSNSAVANQVFVPQHRLLPYEPVLTGRVEGIVDPEVRYRSSFTGLFAIALPGAMIGGAQAALEAVLEGGARRPVAGSTYSTQYESPTFQLDVATASWLLETARLVAGQIAHRVDHFAARGENTDDLTRARNRMDVTEVMRLCRQAIDTLMTAHGSAAFHEKNVLQRIWRDINVGSRHAGFGMGIPQQVYGRALVGQEPRAISTLL